MMLRWRPIVLTATLVAGACETDPDLRALQDPGGGSAGGAGGEGSPTPGFSFEVRDGGSVPAAEPLVTARTSCAEQVHKAERVPLDVYLVVDSSESMLRTTVVGGPTKWAAVRSALETFIKDPNSAGLGVSLQYFPSSYVLPPRCDTSADCGPSGVCNIPRWCANTVMPGVPLKRCTTAADCPAGVACSARGRCSANFLSCMNVGQPCEKAGGTCVTFGATCDRCVEGQYSVPAVPVQDLPGNAGALLSSLAERKPYGGTPMGLAVRGTLSYLQSRMAAAKTRRRAVLVLATDGLPNACTPNTVAGIAAELAAAKAPPLGAPTYLIGVLTGDRERLALEQLATAGGTGMPFVVNVSSGDLTKAFLESLNQIRGASLACEYPIPTLSGSDAVDFSRVNLSFTPKGGQPSILGAVKDQAACHPTKGGWYYDVDPATGTPGHIVVCPATCQIFQQDFDGRVDIRYGCKTKVIE